MMRRPDAIAERNGLAWIAVGAVCGAVAVGIGAFGAHGLKPHLTAEMQAVFETGVRYHFLHAFALMACGILARIAPHFRASLPGWAFLLGTILFSGSLYALALTEASWLGAVTPVGGVLFIAGWILVAWRAAVTPKSLPTS